jgi:hypothetical protein
MSKTNYTPAPWTVDGTTAAENLDVISKGGRVAMLDCDDIDADTLEANARLIAAAPDLLEALQDAEFLLRKAGQLAGAMQDSFNRSAADARAAIQKATGGEQ